MGYRSNADIYAKCPFFVGDSRTAVRCEGGAQGRIIIQKFASEEEKRRFQKRYCFDESCWCEIAALIREKYAGGEKRTD